MGGMVLKGIKVRASVVFAVIMVVVWLLRRAFGLQKTPQLINLPQILAAATVAAYWMSLATNAWQYFQVGKGVNSATGLACFRSRATPILLIGI